MNKKPLYLRQILNFIKESSSVREVIEKYKKKSLKKDSY